MNRTRTAGLDIRSFWLGVVAMLALGVVGWCVYRVAFVRSGPPDEVVGGDKTARTEPQTPPPDVRPRETGREADVATPDAPRDSAPPEPELKIALPDAETAEEAEAGKAGSEDPALAEANRQADREHELAYMNATFDNNKARLMQIIDAYFELPMDERPDYLRTAFEELRKTVEAERTADGMPARPPQGPAMMQEFMKTFSERSTEEEKVKVKQFFGDVMQMQMARFQAEMERRLDGAGGN